MSFGTLDWGRATRGRLRLRDQLVFVRDGLRARRALGRIQRSDVSDAELRDVARRPLPSSALIAIAERACRGESPAWLVEHCLRSFLWGELLGARDRLAVDRDALFLAALLHDLGLTATHAPRDGECFAIVGAEAARALLADAGAPDELGVRVAEAIALHIDPLVPAAAHGSVAHLLNAGTAADVIGARVRELPRDVVDAIVVDHPRHGATAALRVAMAEQSRRSPRTRIAWLCRAGFLRRIERAPFSD